MENIVLLDGKHLLVSCFTYLALFQAHPAIQKEDWEEEEEKKKEEEEEEEKEEEEEEEEKEEEEEEEEEEGEEEDNTKRITFLTF